MSYSDRISTAINRLPNELAVIVSMDIDKRISDWRATGGSEDAPYIAQQVRYAENVAKRFEEGDIA